MNTMNIRLFLAVAVLLAHLPLARAQQATDSDAALAQQLSNPVASLISVPFQSNYDGRIGPVDGGRKFYVNFQPVIPISLGPDWNVVSRTIVPIVAQDNVVPGSGSQFGLSDTLQSLFFTPKAAGPGGIIWGIGPAILLPTATDRLLGGEKWAAGPTGVALRQSGPWTVGMLANHVWSFAGNGARSAISNTFLQPFVAYTTSEAWTLSLNTESTYDWIAARWAVPLNLNLSKLLTIGTQPISIGAGIRYWAASPDNGPAGFGGRFTVTFLFPTSAP